MTFVCLSYNFSKTHPAIKITPLTIPLISGYNSVYTDIAEIIIKLLIYSLKLTPIKSLAETGKIALYFFL